MADTSKKKIGLWLPEALADDFDRFVEERFEGRKGRVLAAAMLLYLTRDEQTQRKFVSKAIQLETGWSLAEVLGADSPLDEPDAPRRRRR